MKHSVTFAGVLTLAILSALSCTTEQMTSPTLAEKLDSISAAYLTMDGPGGAVLVAVGDSVLFSKGYGAADLGTKEDITTKTLFNLGSVSKTFVSNTILMLALEQKLSVEDSLLKYFPEFKNKEIARKVKIKHLLTHTSGLPDNRNVNADTVFYLTANDAQNWQPVTQAESLVFEPGTQYEYSNPAYNGLALIIEKVTGKKWQDVVAERIFGPSGMRTSTITDGAHPLNGVAHGYIRNNNTWKEDDYGEEPTFCAAGNGGVWSSVDELYNYERAMRYSQFSAEQELNDSRTIKSFPNWTSSEPPFIGWSWFIDEKSYGVKTVGHTGTQGGFYCNYVTVPDEEVLVVILANFPFEREKMTDAMMTLLKNSEWAQQSRSSNIE
jgi:CubicO group peptidase (beta-lactamase class C family)